jgi:serine/threonine protein kinase
MTHMAPEIMIKGHISKAADVYALGMVLWGKLQKADAFSMSQGTCRR